MFGYKIYKCIVGENIKRIVVGEINEIRARWMLYQYLRDTYPGHRVEILE